MTNHLIDTLDDVINEHWQLGCRMREYVPRVGPLVTTYHCETCGMILHAHINEEVNNGD